MSAIECFEYHPPHSCAVIMSTSCPGSTFLSLSVFHTMLDGWSTAHATPRSSFALVRAWRFVDRCSCPPPTSLLSALCRRRRWCRPPSLSPQAMLAPYPSRSHLPTRVPIYHCISLSSSVVVLSEMTPRLPLVIHHVDYACHRVTRGRRGRVFCSF